MESDSIENVSALTLLYNSAAENIRLGKRQQWYALYYGLAVYGVFFGFHRLNAVAPLFPSLDFIFDWIEILIVLVAISGTFILCRLQLSLQSSRLEIEGIAKKFPAGIKEIRDLAQGWRTRFFSDGEFFLAHVLVINLTGAFVAFLYSGERGFVLALEIIFMAVINLFLLIIFNRVGEKRR